MNTKAAHQALLQAARDRTTITYGEIVGLAGLTLTGNVFSGQLGWLFHDIVQSELAKDLDAPMLSAVALPKDDNCPSDGFFELARQLKRLDSTRSTDEDAFWVHELNRVYDYLAVDRE